MAAGCVGAESAPEDAIFLSGSAGVVTSYVSCVYVMSVLNRSHGEKRGRRWSK